MENQIDWVQNTSYVPLPNKTINFQYEKQENYWGWMPWKWTDAITKPFTISKDMDIDTFYSELKKAFNLSDGDIPKIRIFSKANDNPIVNIEDFMDNETYIMRS